MAFNDDDSVYSESISSYFESESTQESHSGDNKCHICEKKSIFRSKKICRFCNRVVCSDHSQKRRFRAGYDEPQRICVACDEKIILKEVNDEIDADIEKLGKEIMTQKLLKETNWKNLEENGKAIASLQEEIANHEKILMEFEEGLKKKLNDEIKKGEKIRSDIEFLRGNLDKHIESEKSFGIESNAKEIELRESLTLKDQIILDNLETTNEIDRLHDLFKESVPRAELNSFLCHGCSSLLGDYQI